MGSSISSGCEMSWRLKTKRSLPRSSSMLPSEPVIKLSTQITSWPRSRKRSHRWEPMKPAPPVIKVRKLTSSAIIPLHLLYDSRRCEASGWQHQVVGTVHGPYNLPACPPGQKDEG